MINKLQEKKGKKKELHKQTQNNEENGNRNIYIDSYLKCTWIKCSNQKKQTGWMDIKTRQVYMLSTRDILQDLGTHTD